MSVESINPKSNETLANRAKGIAKQMLNLVNQALFDGAKESADFSAVLEHQKSSESKILNKEDSSNKYQEESAVESINLEVTNTEPKHSKELKNQSAGNQKLDQKEAQSASPQSEITEAQEIEDLEHSEQEILLSLESESAQEVAGLSANNAEIIATVTQNQLIAASTILQAQVKPEKAVITDVSGEKSTEETVSSEQVLTDEAIMSEGSEIPQEIAEKIKQLKPQDLKQTRAALAQENLGQEIKEFAQAQQELKPQEGTKLSPEFKVENFHANKLSQEKAQLAANLQQFVAQNTVKDILLSNATLLDQLKNINPDNLSSFKTASTAIKIASDSSILSLTKPAVASALGSAQSAAFNNTGSQDMGQKLENSQNSKPLSKSQLLSTMEKVEAVLKKIADSKDGSTISLRLDPPQLGSVRADVSLKDGVLHARLTAENTQVLQLLRDRASDLQVTLRKMGLDVEKVSISVNSSDLGTFSGDAEDRQGKNGTRQGSFFSAQADFAESTDSNILDHWIA